jgi:hypothetical protein
MKRLWLLVFLALLPASANAEIPADEPAWVHQGSGRCCPPPFMPGGAVPKSWSCRSCSPMSDEYRQALRAIAYGDFSECYRSIAYRLQAMWKENAVVHECQRGHDLARTSRFYNVVTQCWKALDAAARDAETASRHFQSAGKTAGAQHARDFKLGRDHQHRALDSQAAAFQCINRVFPTLVNMGKGTEPHGTDLYGVQ